MIQKMSTNRVLFLDGEDGSVGCRIHGVQQRGTTPTKSRNKTWECATRSLLRMKNLVAVRGLPGQSMIGPADYYGNLEDAHEHVYMISIQDCVPTVFAIKNGKEPVTALLKPVHDEVCFDVDQYRWVSGHLLADYYRNYNITADIKLGSSLFPNPGMLELAVPQIELPVYGPGTDLLQYRARLVKNDVPFKLVTHKLRHADEFRLVSYIYEHNYAAAQMCNPGGGLFLELHRFAQFITPLSPKCGGYVVLARRDSCNQLCMIAVQVPFGFTLIIDDGAIHGDATLQGMFLMGMTSDHTSMQTADTVFLKTDMTFQNVVMKTNIREHPFVLSDLPPDARPITAHTPITTGKVFNPFSRGYWTSLWNWASGCT